MGALFLPFILAFAPPDSSTRAKQLCARVLQLQPAADPRWACSFAAELDRQTERMGMDPYLSLAIAMQESSLRPGVVGPTGDQGVFQFHPGTMKRYGIDARRLDGGAYSIEQHLRILADKLNVCRDRRGWSCYHSTTPHLRAKYERAVLRYFKERKDSV